MIDPTRTFAQRCTAQMRYASPLGTLLLARTAEGLAGAWFENQKHHPAPIDAPERDDDALLRRAARELEAYFDGADDDFDVPLDLHGTPFQRAVWRELLKLERGATCSYGDIAERLGSPSAGRAVGAAVGRNPISFVVPCHRVLGRSGALTGYHWGLARKQAIIGWEAGQVGGA